MNKISTIENKYQKNHKLSKTVSYKNNKVKKSELLNEFKELELKEIVINIENAPDLSTFQEEGNDKLNNSSLNMNKNNSLISNKLIGKKYLLTNKEKNVRNHSDKKQLTKNENNQNSNSKNNLFSTKKTNKKPSKKKEGIMFKNVVIKNNKKKIKMNFYLYYSILKTKHISDQTVININTKLCQFESSILYAMINISNLLVKVNDEQNNDPKKMSIEINNYEKYILGFYNETFEIRIQYLHILSKLKKDSIPHILKNISKLKVEPTLAAEEKTELEEMEKTLNDYSHQIDGIKNKFEIKINELFQNYVKLFKTLEELKAKFIKKIK